MKRFTRLDAEVEGFTVGFLISALCFLLGALALSGCASTLTIRPAEVRAATPSFDGNVANGGVEIVEQTGATVTAHWIDRWNAMVPRYGKAFLPPLQLIPPTGKEQRVTKQQLLDFESMNRARKATP